MKFLDKQSEELGFNGTKSFLSSSLYTHPPPFSHEIGFREFKD
jgi:hypothetical protein